MKKRYMLIAIASVVLASCSSDIAPPTAQDVALGVKVNVLSTKAIIEGEVFDKTPIGLVIGLDNGYTSSVSAYTQESAGAEWLSTNKIYLSNKEASIYGFYPCPAEPVADTDVDLAGKKLLKVAVADAVADFKGTAQNDYMYATGRVKTSAEGVTPETYSYPALTASNAADKKTVNLWFHHALSKLTFRLNKDALFVGACKVTKVKIENEGGTDSKGIFMVGTAGKMDLANGTLSDLTQSKTITLSTTEDVNVLNQTKDGNSDYGKVVIGADTNPKFFIQALVAPITLPTTVIDGSTPASLSNSIKLTLTVKGDSGGAKDMVVYLPNTASLTNWEAGKNYIYTISIGATALIVDKTVNIVKWGDVPGADLTVN